MKEPSWSTILSIVSVSTVIGLIALYLTAAYYQSPFWFSGIIMSYMMTSLTTGFLITHYYKKKIERKIE